MKAIQQIEYKEISESIAFSEIEKPSITKDEVLIEIYAAGVNPLDIKVIEGKLKSMGKLKLPATLGFDVSGIIIEKGDNVTNFNIGDEVFSKVNKPGAFAEFVAINHNLISLKPKNTNFEEAASLALVGLTAIQALKRGKLKSGETILIHAGSGGVGSFAIQYAKAKGAYVYTTTSTENVEWVKALGADHVIDYKTEDYKTIIKNVDMVLDTLGQEYTEDAFKVIKNGGRVITLVGPIDEETAERMGLNTSEKDKLEEKRSKITKQINIKSAYYSLLIMGTNATQLNEIVELVELGKIKAKIDKVFPLKDTLDALLYVKKGRTKGKVVIKIK